jgi:hypothetical protein
MSIAFTCKCGTKIRLPDSAAGRKARCKNCQTVLRVPKRDVQERSQSASQASTIKRVKVGRRKPVAEEPPVEQPQEPPRETGDWLEEFASAESDADPIASVTPPPVPGAPTAAPPRPPTDDGLIPLSDDDDDDILAPEVPRPEPTGLQQYESHLPDARSATRGPERPFWTDLLYSFIFFTNPGNLVTYIVFAVLLFLGDVAPIPFLGLIMGAYVGAFLLSVIPETASGEDDFPNLAISSFWDDITLPLLQFYGTILVVFLPAGALALIMHQQAGEVNWWYVGTLAALGLFFWPVVVLAVTIGQSFSGVWPHTVIQTALSAPLAYLAVWGMLLATVGGVYAIQLVIEARLAANLPFQTMLGLAFVNTCLSLYMSIVTMRTIGLFYRHYKHRFPWTAE